jgi:site-specific DNA-adenine methylase
MHGRGVVVPFFGTGADSYYMHQAGLRLDALADGNPHLVALLRALREKPTETCAEAARLSSDMPADGAAQHAWYYERRAEYVAASRHLDAHDPLVAALFLVVWRLAFNGLMSCNAQGVFNAPAGMSAKYPKRTIYDADALAAFAHWLGEVPSVSLAEYPETLARALPGDLAYLDPPYEGTFDGYFGKRFKTDDLVREVRGAESRGVLWAMSNSVQARWAADFPGAAVLTVDRAQATLRSSDMSARMMPTRCRISLTRWSSFCASCRYSRARCRARRAFW